MGIALGWVPAVPIRLPVHQINEVGLDRKNEVRISKMADQDCRDTVRPLGFGRLGCSRDNQPCVVPIYFACEADKLYGFATFGQKIDWMRSNPLVCVKCDEIVGNDDWTSVVVLGRYEELPDAPRYSQARTKAQSPLEKQAMWWGNGLCSFKSPSTSGITVTCFLLHSRRGISGLRASCEGSPVRVR
jgi:nitroimidazol reductase NimA-like FMN-containing flavoprotein (pyridoxamine 5'-phosphate oxidase superfamily)